MISPLCGTRRGPARLLLVAILLLLIHPSGVAATAAGWAKGFHRQGTTGAVNSIRVISSRLNIAGGFENFGDVVTDGVGAWDGTRVERLGPEPKRFIRDLVEFQGRIFAGGVGGVGIGTPPEFFEVAAWDGVSWAGVGNASGQVLVLGTFGESLVAAGTFSTVNGVPTAAIASWNGVDWSPLGAGIGDLQGSPRGVVALCEYQGVLYAGGGFRSAGGQPAQGLAAWDGAVWRPIVTNGTVLALHVHDGKLVIGGTFTEVAGVSASRLAQWDGAQWSELGGGTDGQVASPETYHGMLVAGGRFQNAGDVAALRVAAWDGTNWHPLGQGIPSVESSSEAIEALCAWGDDLYAGGNFLAAGDVAADRIARWDGATWHPVGSSGNGVENATRVTEWQGKLITIGRFVESASPEGVHSLAAWDGSAWDPLGSRFVAVADVASFKGGLIALGEARDASGDRHYGIHAWDGTAWQLAAAIAHDNRFSAVLDVLLATDDFVYVGGMFTGAGGGPAQGVVRWDGAAFLPMNGSFAGPDAPGVRSLAIFEGAVIAGGSFTSVDGQPASAVARWDGSRWRPLGGGLSTVSAFPGPVVNAVLTYGTDLIAVGRFDLADGVPANGIARWDGTNWRPFFGGIESGDEIFSAFVHHGELVVSGRFESIGGVPARGLASWNGAAWSELGGGLGMPLLGTGVLHNQATDMTSWRGALVLAGDFYLAGGRASVGIALWGGGPGTGKKPGAAQLAAIRQSGIRLVSSGLASPEGTTTVRFTLGNRAHVRAEVFNVRGQRVRRLADSEFSAGEHRLMWDGRDAGGRSAAAGIYYWMLVSGSERRSLRTTLLK